MEITKEQFESALLIVKNYKIQEYKLNKNKQTIVEQVLSLNETETKDLLLFVFNGKLELRYSIVVNRLYYYLNNIALIKTGTINTKKIFKEYLNNGLIFSKELNKKYNLYYTV